MTGETIHQPLNVENKEFRLLILDPAENGSTKLRAKLEVRSLKHPGAYKCLSYACGQDLVADKMIVGDQVVSIYENLFHALRDLRQAHQPLTIWIDQLCINQTDMTEKTQQVQMMGNIYASAEEVLAYIGQDLRMYEEQDPVKRANLETGKAFDHMERISKLPITTHADETGYDNEALFSLTLDTIMIFRRPWWIRMWTAQEMILAKKISFIWGHRRVSNETIQTFCAWWRLHMNSCCTQKAASHTTFPQELVMLLERTYTTLEEYRNAYINGEPRPDLLTMMSVTQHRHATELQDKVFALAGLCEIPKELIDYKLTVQQCFTNATWHILSSGKTLDAFHNITTNGATGSQRWDRRGERGVDDHERLNDLPSWVPDWTLTLKAGDQSLLQTRRRFLDAYNASGTTVSHVQRVDQGITVRGVKCAVVERVGLENNHAMIFNKDMVESWKKTADWSGDPGPKRYNFITTLTSGLTVDQRGGYSSIYDRSSFIRNEYLWEFFWQQYFTEAKIRREEDGSSSDDDSVVLFGDLASPENLVLADGIERSDLEAYCGLIRIMTFRKRFVVTTDGRFGWAPVETQPGDLMCVFNGGRTAFVIGKDQRQQRLVESGLSRKTVIDKIATKNGVDGYQLLGDAYLQGFMNGEAVQMVAGGELNEEDFLLV